MESKASWYRLGVSLLALALIFVAAQTLGWAPDVSAQMNVSSTAGLAAIPRGPAAVPDTLSKPWDDSILTPGD